MNDALHSLLIEAALEQYAETTERQAQPSIRLIAYLSIDEAVLPIGITKLGGSPDLPADFDWPRNGVTALAFIAQINLSEVASYDVRQQLPHSGMLYFFYDYDYINREKDEWHLNPALIDDPATLWWTPLSRH